MLRGLKVSHPLIANIILFVNISNFLSEYVFIMIIWHIGTLKMIVLCFRLMQIMKRLAMGMIWIC